MVMGVTDGAVALGGTGLGRPTRGGGGGVDVRGGAKSVSSFAHSGQTAVPSGLQ